MPNQDTVPADTAIATPGVDAGHGATTPVENTSPDDVSVEAAMADATAAIPADAAQSAADALAAAAPASAPALGAGADSTTIPGATAPAGDGFLSALTAAGFDHTYKTEDEAATAFKELRGKLSERDQLSQIGSAVLPHYDEFQTYLKAKEQPGATAPNAAPKTGWNPPHDFDSSWMAELQKEEEGRNPVVMEKINAYANHANQKWQQWMFNPNQMVQELIVPEVQKMMQGAQAQQQVQSNVSSLISSNNDLCTKYEPQISQMLAQNVPLEMAIEYYKLVEKTSATGPTTIPAAGAAPAAPNVAGATTPQQAAAAVSAGVVVQTPKGAPKDSDEDIERWADPRQAGLDALAAEGIEPPKPGTI